MLSKTKLWTMNVMILVSHFNTGMNKGIYVELLCVYNRLFSNLSNYDDSFLNGF
jgi:hypothetical protein